MNPFGTGMSVYGQAIEATAAVETKMRFAGASEHRIELGMDRAQSSRRPLEKTLADELSRFCLGH